MKIVYGPIASWRLGRSLGVDLICQEKRICSFDCIYCQLRHSEQTTAQKDAFVSMNHLREELTSALEKTTPDVITFSGMGEPTLATNMNKAITLIRKLTILPIAILTNSTLFFDKTVQQNLQQLDIIVAKLDAPNQQLFQKINRPAQGITFDQTLQGIKALRHTFKGKFALQMMFIQENKDYASDLADLAREIQPNEVQINTPLRHCGVQPLSKRELAQIQHEFSSVHTISVYTRPKPQSQPLDMTELVKRSRMEP